MLGVNRTYIADALACPVPVITARFGEQLDQIRIDRGLAVALRPGLTLTSIKIVPYAAPTATARSPAKAARLALVPAGYPATACVWQGRSRPWFMILL
jgi:hypothetical protein